MTTKAEDMTPPGTLLMVPDVPPEMLAAMQEAQPGWSHEDCQFCSLLMHHAEIAHREFIGNETMHMDAFRHVMSVVIARFVENREELAATMALLAIKPERKRRLAMEEAASSQRPE